jgi:hypothetical protein
LVVVVVVVVVETRKKLKLLVTTDQSNIAIQCLSGFNPSWTVCAAPRLAVTCTFNIYLIYTFFTASLSLLFRMINCLPVH